MYRFFSILFALIALSAFAAAQADGTSSRRVDVFGGFSYIPQDPSLTTDGTAGITGWNASVAFPAWHPVSMVVDFSGYYPGYNVGCIGCGQHAKIHTFLVGPQISVTRGRISPFARFLLGDTYMHTFVDGLSNYVVFTSSNSFTFGAGGGADVSLTHRFALRGQVDWLHNGFTTTDNQRRYEERHNLARISTGIVIHF